MTQIIMAHHSDPKPEWPWPNFTPKELASKGNGEVRVNIVALNMLQALRTAWGKPLHLNSVYRNPAYNKKVGGAKRSLHLLGMAFDVSTAGWTKQEKHDFKELAHEIGFTGFGGYNSFIHIDIGRKRKWGQKWAWPDVFFT